MKNLEAFYQLIAELEQDYDFIQESTQKNHLMDQRIQTSKHPDEFDYAALGYTLHNLYNAYEAYFFRIAKFFENNLDEATWHKSLLQRMTLTIENVRPQVIPIPFAHRLEELLRFRHVFRNLYKTSLNPEKVRFVQTSAQGLQEDFAQHHNQFIQFVRDLGKRVGNG